MVFLLASRPTFADKPDLVARHALHAIVEHAVLMAIGHADTARRKKACQATFGAPPPTDPLPSPSRQQCLSSDRRLIRDLVFAWFPGLGDRKDQGDVGRINVLASQIVAAALTTKNVDDGAEIGPLLDQVTGPVASFTADRAYDQEGVTAAVAERHPAAAIIVPPRSTAVPSETAATAPTQRDCHLKSIAEHGRAAWQKGSGYTKRARLRRPSAGSSR